METPGEGISSEMKKELESMLEDFSPPIENNEYVMTEQEKSRLLTWLNKTHDERWMAQIEARRRWAKLRDYDAGRQAWDSTQNILVGHEMASAQSEDGNIDDEYHIFNIIRRVSGSNVQRLSGYSIQPSVTPDSTDPDDKEGARLGRVALNNLYRELGANKIKRQIATSVNKFGSVFQKVYFDPKRGRKVYPLVEVPSEIPGEPPTIQPDTKLSPEGEVVKKYFTPMHIVLPVNTHSIEDCDELEEVHVETTNWIWREHNMKVEPESVIHNNVWSAETADTVQRDVEYQHGASKNSVVYKVRYINPCPEFIRGACIFYIRKHIFRCTDLLSYHESIQEIWQSASAIEKEDTPFGDSWLWDLIPVQDGLNTSLTASLNFIEGYGLLQYQANASANLKLDKVNNAQGNIMIYQGEKGLEPLQHTPLPATHGEVTQAMLSMSESLGAAHDIRRPVGTPSGNAINSLRQIDDSMLRPCVESIGEMLQKGDRTALKLMGEKYTNPRLMKMMGKEGWEIHDDFTGKMLNGNYNATITLLTGLSDDPGVRLEEVLKLNQAGIISDPTEARMLLGMDNTDDMMEAIQKENEIAARFVKGLADYPGGYTFDPTNATPPTPKVIRRMWQNHQLIVTKELTWMRENFDHADPAVQAAFESDLEWRQSVLAALTMPPPPGGGAPPEAMAPNHGFGAPPPGAGPGQAPPKKTPGANSSQHPNQQPPRPVVGPMSTGSHQVAAP